MKIFVRARITIMGVNKLASWELDVFLMACWRRIYSAS
jgi:hypothetical protein